MLAAAESPVDGFLPVWAADRRLFRHQDRLPGVSEESVSFSSEHPTHAPSTAPIALLDRPVPGQVVAQKSGPCAAGERGSGYPLRACWHYCRGKRLPALQSAVVPRLQV